MIRLPVLLPQKKAGNNSYKLKLGIRQIVFASYQQNKIIKTGVIIRNSKLVVIIELKTINFVLTKDGGNNFKHENDFIIKHKELLNERTIK